MFELIILQLLQKLTIILVESFDLEGTTWVQ